MATFLQLVPFPSFARVVDALLAQSVNNGVVVIFDISAECS